MVFTGKYHTFAPSFYKDAILLHLSYKEQDTTRYNTNLFGMKNQTIKSSIGGGYQTPHIHVYHVPVENGFNNSLQFGEAGSAGFADGENELEEF